MGMFYGAQLQAMLPKLHSTNFEGMELIRPLYCIDEENIISWCKTNGLQFIQCACRFTEQYSHAADGIGDSKRQEVKKLLSELSKTYPDIRQSVFDSIHNLDLDTMPEYKSGDTIHKLYGE
jgi:tRNA(Ile)-lysidine synthase TilS/MesJ